MFLFLEHAKAGKECWEENLQQTKQHSQITGAKQSGIFAENITVLELPSCEAKRCIDNESGGGARDEGIRKQDPSNYAEGNGKLLRNLNSNMSYVCADVCCL